MKYRQGLGISLPLDLVDKFGEEEDLDCKVFEVENINEIFELRSKLSNKEGRAELHELHFNLMDREDVDIDRDVEIYGETEFTDEDGLLKRKLPEKDLFYVMFLDKDRNKYVISTISWLKKLTEIKIKRTERNLEQLNAYLSHINYLDKENKKNTKF